MKVGILTFHRAYNYGAFLQALALKTYIEGLGHNVEIIDYESEEHHRAYAYFNTQYFNSLKIRGKLSYSIKVILGALRKAKREKKMQWLQTKYLQLMGRSFRNIKDVDSDYDCIIYGSDQIWSKGKINPNKYFDSVYWGDGFNGIPKITYAPSMGVIDLNDLDKEYIYHHLGRFKSLSVREKDLKQVLQPLTNSSIEVVVDPVFLLDKEYWDNKASRGVLIDKYLLVYNLMHDKGVINVANELAKKKGLRVIEITGSVQPYIFDKDVIQDGDPFDFISLIKNAEYIVTSSFHAVAFSIIFRKDFYALGMKNNSKRVLSLLQHCGLEDRLISSITDIADKPIDYSNGCLDALIEKSKLYLNESISNI